MYTYVYDTFFTSKFICFITRNIDDHYLFICLFQGWMDGFHAPQRRSAIDQHTSSHHHQHGGLNDCHGRLVSSFVASSSAIISHQHHQRGGLNDCHGRLVSSFVASSHYLHVRQQPTTCPQRVGNSRGGFVVDELESPARQHRLFFPTVFFVTFCAKHDVVAFRCRRNEKARV